MLELNELSAGYGKTPVLQEISLAFEKGTLTSIVGVNGCGKSTLLKTVIGILPPLKGEVRIDGVRLDTMRRKEIARKIAYLSQEKSIPDMTVEQLILHGRFPHHAYAERYTEEDRKIANAAMAQLGISHLAEKPLSVLSGGMRQSAYLAMALSQDADYILLDEPTAYLDIAHQLSLAQTLKALADQGKGIVVVLHDLPLALSVSHRVALLDGGGLRRVDTPNAIVSSGLLETVFGVSLCRESEGSGFYYKL